MILSFDFDDTIHICGEINKPIRKIIFAAADAGHKVYICTARSGKFLGLESGTYEIPGIRPFIEAYQLPIEDIIFTNHELKGRFLRKIKADCHYDDRLDHLDSCLKHGIKAFWVDEESIFEYTYDAMKRVHPVKGTP